MSANDALVYGPRFGALLYTLSVKTECSDYNGESGEDSEEPGGTHFNASADWEADTRDGTGDTSDSIRGGYGGVQGGRGDGSASSDTALDIIMETLTVEEYLSTGDYDAPQKHAYEVTSVLEVVAAADNIIVPKLIVASSDDISSGRIDVYDLNEYPGLLCPQVALRGMPPVTCMTEIVVKDTTSDSYQTANWDYHGSTSRTRRLLVVGCGSKTSSELRIWDLEDFLGTSTDIATTVDEAVPCEENGGAPSVPPQPLLVLVCGDARITKMRQHQHDAHRGQSAHEHTCLLVEFRNGTVKYFAMSCGGCGNGAAICNDATSAVDSDGGLCSRSSSRAAITATCFLEHTLSLSALEERFEVEQLLCCMSDKRRVTYRLDSKELRVYAAENSAASANATATAGAGSTYTVLRRFEREVYSAIELLDGRLATCSFGGGMHIWDICHDDDDIVSNNTQQYACIQTVPTDDALFVIQLPQGHLVSWGGYDMWAVCIWTYDAKTQSFASHPVVSAVPEVINVVALSEGTLLAAVTEYSLSVHILDTATGSPVITLHNSCFGVRGAYDGSITCLVPLCGERLAVGDTSGLVHVWDLPALGDQRWHRRRPLVLLLVAAVARKHATTATAYNTTGGSSSSSGAGHDGSRMVSAMAILDVVRHIASYLG